MKKEDGNVNDEVVVWVKDTGTGIDSQIFPRLFSKFATKSEVGDWIRIIHIKKYRRGSRWQNMG